METSGSPRSYPILSSGERDRASNLFASAQRCSRGEVKGSGLRALARRGDASSGERRNAERGGPSRPPPTAHTHRHRFRSSLSRETKRKGWRRLRRHGLGGGQGRRGAKRARGEWVVFSSWQVAGVIRAGSCVSGSGGQAIGMATAAWHGLKQECCARKEGHG